MLGHRLVHLHELVPVTSMLDVPVLPNPLVESFEGKDLLADAVEDELRQLLAGKTIRAWGGGRRGGGARPQEGLVEAII